MKLKISIVTGITVCIVFLSLPYLTYAQPVGESDQLYEDAVFEEEPIVGSEPSGYNQTPFQSQDCQYQAHQFSPYPLLTCDDTHWRY